MFGLTEIKKVQNQGTWAKHDVGKAAGLLLDVIQFLCCNKFMRLLRLLFKKKFDEQYNKLSKAYDWLNSASESLEHQWDLLEQYWDQTANNTLENYEEFKEDEM